MTGRHVLLTRPDGENEALARRLAASSVKVSIRPLIRLSAEPLSAAIKQTAIDLDLIDLIVFVSKSAVTHGMPVLDSYWPQWPQKLEWFAVGEGTAELLREHGVRAFHPEKAGSEGLLGLPGLQDIAGKRVLIVRGSGGRELLASELKRRGARVGYWEIYRRDPVSYKGWDELVTEDMIAVATSTEICLHLASELKRLATRIHLVVASARIAEAAGDPGFKSISIAAGASEQALYDAVMQRAQIIGQGPEST